MSTQTRYSTERLEQIRTEGDQAHGRGPYREAVILLRHADVITTPEQRARIIQIAHTGQNLGVWTGRWSDAVHYATLALVAMVTEGREDEEHYVEKTAREYREDDDRERALQRRIVAGAFGR